MTKDLAGGAPGAAWSGDAAADSADFAEAPAQRQHHNHQQHQQQQQHERRQQPGRGQGLGRNAVAARGRGGRAGFGGCAEQLQRNGDMRAFLVPK